MICRSVHRLLESRARGNLPNAWIAIHKTKTVAQETLPGKAPFEEAVRGEWDIPEPGEPGYAKYISDLDRVMAAVDRHNARVLAMRQKTDPADREDL